jgi:hypothetical protein
MCSFVVVLVCVMYFWFEVFRWSAWIIRVLVCVCFLFVAVCGLFWCVFVWWFVWFGVFFVCGFCFFVCIVLWGGGSIVSELVRVCVCWSIEFIMDVELRFKWVGGL